MNGKILIACLFIFKVAEVNGQQVIPVGWYRITVNPTDDFHASFSPDGKKILFDSDRSGHNEIYKYEIATGETIQLTRSSLKTDHPRWSPDGNQICYEMYDTVLQTYIMRADGSGPTRLTNSRGHNAAANISPDGKKILFVSTRDGNWELYTMNKDGTHQTRITNNNGEDGNPQWSPDGSKILFRSQIGKNFQICSIRADGSHYRQLTNNKAANEGPRWSPDGKTIAFASVKDDNCFLYKMNADGTRLFKLNVPANASDLTWSPDGLKLLFVSGNEDDADIWIINADGSHLKNLTHNKAREANPSWSPDGKSILFVSTVTGNLEIYSMALN